MDPSTLIRFDGADLGYGKTTILKNVSCSIERGESVGLVGPNGSGKTTFLRSVLALLNPARGNVEVDRSQKFAYVPQVDELNLYLPLSLKDVVYLANKSKRVFGKTSFEEARAAESSMARTAILEIGDLLFREASGGQRQKTILAQALSQKPDVLLLDEPTRGLDVVAERDLLALIEQFRLEEKLTILFVTHSLQIPLNFMEKILLFNKGTVIPTTSDELVHTKKLEEIYGVPFLHHEHAGFRWVAPL